MTLASWEPLGLMVVVKFERVRRPGVSRGTVTGADGDNREARGILFSARCRGGLGAKSQLLDLVGE